MDNITVPMIVHGKVPFGQNWTVFLVENDSGNARLVHIHNSKISLYDQKAGKLNIPLNALERTNKVDGVMPSIIWILGPKKPL